LPDTKKLRNGFFSVIFLFMTEITTEAKSKSSDTEIDALFAVGAHYGYSRSRRHPSFVPFLLCNKNSVDVIDLEQTIVRLNTAKAFVAELGKMGKQILFVGTKSVASSITKNAAQDIGMPYVSNRWIGGTLTNFPEIKKRVARLVALRAKREKGELGQYTKKERLMFDREIERLEKHFGGIVGMTDKPAALFIVDFRNEKIAIGEAQGMRVPIIGFGSSDSDVKHIEYLIPANDAVQKSIAFFVQEIADAYKAGMKAKIT
jgi:small subunit ribosomal protein S2